MLNYRDLPLASSLRISDPRDGGTGPARRQGRIARRLGSVVRESGVSGDVTTVRCEECGDRGRLVERLVGVEPRAVIETHLDAPLGFHAA